MLLYFPTGLFDIFLTDLWQFFIYSVLEYFWLWTWNNLTGCCLSFKLVYDSPVSAGIFYFKTVSIFNFFLYGLCFLCHVLKNSFWHQSHFARFPSNVLSFIYPHLYLLMGFISCLMWAKELIRFCSTWVTNCPKLLIDWSIPFPDLWRHLFHTKIPYMHRHVSGLSACSIPISVRPFHLNYYSFIIRCV